MHERDPSAERNWFLGWIPVALGPMILDFLANLHVDDVERDLFFALPGILIYGYLHLAYLNRQKTK